MPSNGQHHQSPSAVRPPTLEDIAAVAAQLDAAHERLRIARRRLYRLLEARAAHGGRQEGVCGTPAGYRRHQRDDEPPCDPCVDAWTWDRGRRTRRAA